MTIAHGPSMTTTARPGGRNGMVHNRKIKSTKKKLQRNSQKVAASFVWASLCLRMYAGEPSCDGTCLLSARRVATRSQLHLPHRPSPLSTRVQLASIRASSDWRRPASKKCVRHCDGRSSCKSQTTLLTSANVHTGEHSARSNRCAARLPLHSLVMRIICALVLDGQNCLLSCLCCLQALVTCACVCVHVCPTPNVVSGSVAQKGVATVRTATES
jgi:hypothetical protein